MMRRSFRLLALLSLLALPAAGQRLRVLLPLYVYPTANARVTTWARVAQAGRQVPLTVIINPSDGPLAPAARPIDYDEYRQAIALLRGTPGLVVLGYVRTDYGRRAAADVRADVDLYAGAYSVDGIFFDEVPEAGSVALYRGYCAYARTRYGTTVLNPGTTFDPAYLEGGDYGAAVGFESTGAAWASAPGAPAGLLPAQVGVLVHAASGSAAMETALDRARTRGYGLVYVTDDVEPNPWDSLPTYWDAEVAAVAALNAATAREPEPTGVALGVTVFPTPARQTLTVQTPGAFEAILVDVLGRTVAQANGEGAARMALAGLSAGLYVLQVRANGRRTVVAVPVVR